MADKTKRRTIACDFCSQPTTPDQVDAWGIAKCKVCHAEEVIGRADGVFVAWQVDELRAAVKEARKLFRQGKTELAFMAGQAAWNLALGLHNAIESKVDVQTGRRARKQRSVAGFSSGKERAAVRKPEWDEWQAELDVVREAAPRLLKTTAQQCVAEKFGVSRTSIDKRTRWK